MHTTVRSVIRRLVGIYYVVCMCCSEGVYVCVHTGTCTYMHMYVRVCVVRWNSVYRVEFIAVVWPVMCS